MYVNTNRQALMERKTEHLVEQSWGAPPHHRQMAESRILTKSARARKVLSLAGHSRIRSFLSHATCFELDAPVPGVWRVNCANTRLGVSEPAPGVYRTSPERKERKGGPCWMGLDPQGPTWTQPLNSCNGAKHAGLHPSSWASSLSPETRMSTTPGMERETSNGGQKVLLNFTGWQASATEKQWVLGEVGRVTL